MPKPTSTCGRLARLAMLLMAVAAGGCRHYQVGFLPHPELQSIAVGPFANQTTEPALSVDLRSRLAEALMRDGSLRVDSLDQARVVLDGTIVGLRSRQIAAVKGNQDELSDYQAEYRTALYRMAVVVRFSVVANGEERRQIIAEQSVVGEADYPNTPDLEVARGEAIKQAVNDAARQIAAAIVEAW